MATIKKRTAKWRTKAGEERTAERWQARYVGQDGREYARDFKLKRDAQNWLDEQTATLVAGDWVNPASSRQTFRAYATRWIDQQVLRPTTEAQYRIHLDKHILPELGERRLEELDRSMIQTLVKKWSRTSAASTTRSRYGTLATILRAAVADRALPRTPAVKITLPEIPPKHALVPITTEVVAALTEAIDPRFRAFVIVAAGTGMRRSELLGLTRDRVADDFGAILIDRQQDRAASTSKGAAFAPPKTESSIRTIHVAKVVIDAIKVHEKAYGLGEHGLVFTNTFGDPVVPSVLQRAWSAAAVKVGTDATPHDLRHYFASIQLAGGISIKELQAQLGHKKASETLDTYGHLMKTEREHSRALIQSALGGLLAGSAAAVAPDAAAESSGQ